MDAVCGEEENEEEKLESGEGSVGCDEEGWRGAWSEDAVPELFDEGRHVAKSRIWERR